MGHDSERTVYPVVEENLGLREKILNSQNELVVHNTHGRTDTLNLDIESFTGEIDLQTGDDRWMCSHCRKNLKREKARFGQYTGMFVDTDKKIWCRGCWVKHLSWTIRSVGKHPDETRPRYILPGGHYYKLLENKT